MHNELKRSVGCDLLVGMNAVCGMYIPWVLSNLSFVICLTGGNRALENRRGGNISPLNTELSACE